VRTDRPRAAREQLRVGAENVLICRLARVSPNAIQEVSAWSQSRRRAAGRLVLTAPRGELRGPMRLPRPFSTRAGRWWDSSADTFRARPPPDRPNNRTRRWFPREVEGLSGNFRGLSARRGDRVGSTLDALSARGPRPGSNQRRRCQSRPRNIGMTVHRFVHRPTNNRWIWMARFAQLRDPGYPADYGSD
jgi:hypothetical protein